MDKLQRFIRTKERWAADNPDKAHWLQSRERKRQQDYKDRFWADAVKDYRRIKRRKGKPPPDTPLLTPKVNDFTNAAGDKPSSRRSKHNPKRI